MTMGTVTLQQAPDATLQLISSWSLQSWNKCLNDLHTPLESPYDESFIARKREALQQRGVSLLTIQVEPEDVLIH
jgi:hypothetical protein